MVTVLICGHILLARARSTEGVNNFELTGDNVVGKRVTTKVEGERDSTTKSPGTEVQKQPQGTTEATTSSPGTEIGEDQKVKEIPKDRIPVSKCHGRKPKRSSDVMEMEKLPTPALTLTPDTTSKKRTARRTIDQYEEFNKVLEFMISLFSLITNQITKAFIRSMI